MRFHSNQENPFWRFSVKFYSRAGIQSVLINAQDRCASDVNMLLFALWQAANGNEVSSSEYSTLNDAITDWRDTILLPMRDLRRCIKETSEAESACYKQAKALELSYEQIQQSIMYETARRIEGSALTGVAAEELSLKNLKCYAECANPTLPESTIVLLAQEMRTFI